LVQEAILQNEQLRTRIADEISGLLGFGKRGFGRTLLSPFIKKVSSRLASIATGFEERVSHLGFSKASQWILPKFTSELRTTYEANIPSSRPLLIGANHPGGIDALAVTASSKRDDLKIVVSQIPFIRLLPHTSEHMIWSSLDTYERMLVIRSIIRTLKDGGAVLIFPSGTVDPDPDQMSGSKEALQSWSSSIETILRVVPDCQFVSAIVSGVVEPELLTHPITRLRKNVRNRQKVAELLHITRGIFNPMKISLTTRLSFSRPRAGRDFVRNGSRFGREIVRQTEMLLASHCHSRGLDGKPNRAFDDAPAGPF
jgi:hypothetical protein